MQLIDLKAFRRELGEAVHEKSVDSDGLSPYLMQNLLAPYLKGEAIPLDSLDYDAFDLSDLDRLNEYIGEILCVHGRLDNMYRKLRKSIPAARTAKAFF